MTETEEESMATLETGKKVTKPPRKEKKTYPIFTKQVASIPGVWKHSKHSNSNSSVNSNNSNTMAMVLATAAEVPTMAIAMEAESIKKIKLQRLSRRR
jgi:hypothetical protein